MRPFVLHTYFQHIHTDRHAHGQIHSVKAKHAHTHRYIYTHGHITYTQSRTDMHIYIHGHTHTHTDMHARAISPLQQCAAWLSGYLGVCSVRLACQMAVDGLSWSETLAAYNTGMVYFYPQIRLAIYVTAPAPPPHHLCCFV